MKQEQRWIKRIKRNGHHESTIYVLGFILVLISLSVSHLVPNYITLIGVQVPVIFGLLAFGLHYLLDWITDLDLPQWLVPLCYSFFLVAGIVFIMLLWRREKKRDIVL
ncbi:hypothetical protein J8TS2_30590 [Lederbergia ruris]|uniref:Uncharacterized protein n=1 Tax=Lederbergia ruris TaxID=217495 RepID=A0ABQ4KLB2_9BACI|nr:hypothetical protein [Lederbergia ruris]GIN58740.1 hypothetical protein J8TS2_30590 [Lederbergia ruris]